MTVRVEVADAPAATARVVGFKDTVGPDDLTARLTFPEKPVLVRVTVDELEDPMGMVKLTGFAASLRLPLTTTVIRTERISDPLVPVTVIE